MRHFGNLIALILLTTVACQPRVAPEAQELYRAVALALNAAAGELESTGHSLVGAERMVLNGAWVWRVTFKPLHLLPENPGTDFVGLGGEVFVNVNLATEECPITYGE